MILRIRDADGEREVELSRRVATVGRAGDCHLRLRSDGVADVHAVIYRDPAGFRISRADSSLSLLVNGQPAEAHLLEPGDLIVVGGARLEVAPEAAGTAPDPVVGQTPGADVPTADTARALVRVLDLFSRCVLEDEAWPRPAEVLLDALLEVTGAEHGFLLLREGGEPRVVAARPVLDQPGEALDLLSDSIVRQVLHDGQGVVLDDAGHDPTYAAAPSVVRLKLSSVMCLPLGAAAGVDGALYLGHRRRPGLFDARMQAAGRIFCAQAALLLRSARHVESLRGTVADLRRRVEIAAGRELVCQSPRMQQVLALVDRAAPTDISILLLGETGTGKELVARLIHERSRRASGPFVAVNCAAIPETLLESELFGHARGAFTGADRDRTGLLEQACPGTLLLDEVGEMPLPLQAKLLRVLQERSVRRLGENVDRPLDLRLVAASNRELEGAECFRADLYYRLAGLVLALPPLRERTGDLDLLVRLFLGRFAAEFERAVPRLSQAAWERVRRHQWSGNIRELENRMRRAVLMAEQGRIEPEDLGFASEGEGPPEPLAAARDRFVAQHVRETLDRCGGDRAEAARLLGVGLRSLYRYLKLDGPQPGGGAS